MPSRREVQKEYDFLYKANPNKWGGTDRSDFMVNALKTILPNPQTALDVGCGIGVTLETFGKHFPGTILYGIDPSNEAIRLSKEKVPHGHFTTREEFEDIKKFDLVFCLGVAEHVEELASFLASLKAKLNKDGICYIEVPHNLVYSKGLETYRRLTTKSRQLEWHLPRYVWENLLINRAGFEIIERLNGLNATWEFIWVLK